MHYVAGMKSLVQLAAGTTAMVWLAPHLFGTPLYHWMIFAPVFIGSMYAVALAQHWFHLRFSRRGIVGRLGSNPNGRLRTPN